MEIIFSVTTFSLFSRMRISTGNTMRLLQRLLSVRGIGEDHRIVPRRLSATGRTVNFILRSIFRVLEKAVQTAHDQVDSTRMRSLRGLRDQRSEADHDGIG